MGVLGCKPPLPRVLTPPGSLQGGGTLSTLGKHAREMSWQREDHREESPQYDCTLPHTTSISRSPNLAFEQPLPRGGGLELASESPRDGSAQLTEHRCLEVGCVVGSGRHDDEVYSLDVHSGSSLAASGSYDGIVKLWDIATGFPVLIDTLPHPDVVYGVSFSPDGDQLATACACGMACVWDSDDRSMPGRRRRQILKAHLNR